MPKLSKDTAGRGDDIGVTESRYEEVDGVLESNLAAMQVAER
jgi:hypothetical protein